VLSLDRYLARRTFSNFLPIYQIDTAMHASFAIAASGLRHADTRVRSTAHDTANLATPETAVLRAVGREYPVGGGVETLVEGRTERRPELGATGEPTRVSSAGAVSLAAEQISSVHYAGALGNVVRTTDDMLGSLIDILG
jgi:hypothetical protein